MMCSSDPSQVRGAGLILICLSSSEEGVLATQLTFFPETEAITEVISVYWQGSQSLSQWLMAFAYA